MFTLWLKGLVARRCFRLAGATAGIALTVALIAILSLFLTQSAATMTSRAVSGVPIDWQVQMVPGTDTTTVRDAIAKAAPVEALEQVFYAATNGFEAQAGGTVQTTGPGQVIAWGPGYLKKFPKELRLLSGDMTGALIAQQTAANLHVAPGDSVTVHRPSQSDASVTITGVVELPDADALFQAVGLPKQAAPQAPPDNVLILPLAGWHAIFDTETAVRADTTHSQFHVRIDHGALPTQPVAAYTDVTGMVHNLEARVAGQALVSDNLGARLDAVRGDALYARVLFLFLGLPGVTLAAALTLAVAGAGADRRRAEQALLRIRGADRRRVIGFALAEAALAGCAGVMIGLAAAATLNSFALAGGLLALIFAVAAGFILAALALVLPAWRAVAGSTIVAERRSVGRRGKPLWQRLWLDMILLTLAGLAFWQTASTGYQVVLAPEGVPATAVDYKAFLAPALFWIGAALLAIRLVSLALGSRSLAGALRPVAGELAPSVASSLAHQRRRITLGVAMTALALAFGISTAIFNTTYNGQARVDAELTNGADVTAFGTMATPAGPHIAQLRALPGVVAAEPMQHRFAYVGADLQDLYGIDAAKVTNATTLSDAYFSAGTAKEILGRLASSPDAVLVSQETVNDFQLSLGDTINLRLMSAADHQYHPVPFHFVGVAREFPTAPKDSFLVANADYIAKMTNNPAAEYVLMRTAGDPAIVAAEARKALAATPGIRVEEIGTVSHIIGSSLTAVSLGKLTAIELGFSVLMAAAAAGLMLALGIDDRRRGFAVLTALGAKPRQIGAFLWAEGAAVITGGVALGMATGTITAWMLVKLLTGVFDPPPEALALPWLWLGGFLLLTAGAAAVAVEIARRRMGRTVIEALRDF